MKKNVLLLMSIASIFSLSSCNLEDDFVEVKKAPLERNVAEDLEIIKNYMKIDQETYEFNVILTDSIIEAEKLSLSNVKTILNDISELNKKIRESIRLGETTTLCLSTREKFQSYTINGNRNISFTDKLAPLMDAKTRAGFPTMSFSRGNWGNSSVEFPATDHVTSSFYVSEAKGSWQVVFYCNTGTSAYGDQFQTYGTGHTYGSINRYWWYTAGGHGPQFNWRFSANAPIGGEAYGGVSFIDTPQ